MKHMKSIKVALFAAAIFAHTIQSYAIEGLQLKLQSSNVVLSWPSVAGELYIVSYLPAFGTNNSWVELTNQYPATDGTNITSYVHTNAVQYSTFVTNSGSGGSGTNGGSGGPGL
jgi:hypothetical protein